MGFEKPSGYFYRIATDNGMIYDGNYTKTHISLIHTFIHSINQSYIRNVYRVFGYNTGVILLVLLIHIHI